MLYGLDHAQTLAVLVPPMLQVRADGKRQKLLQYAERIWGIKTGSEAWRVSDAIEKTRMFFEQLGVPTRLRDYGPATVDIDQVVSLLQAHGMNHLGENQDVTADVMRRILNLCL